jgi:hypothetical protein
MALRRFVQLFGDEADEARSSSEPLELDRILDSPLSTFSPYRLTLTLVLAGWWLVSTDVYADIWTAHPPNMARCVCESDSPPLGESDSPPLGGAAGVLFGDLVNYSHPSDNPRACAACAARGGRPLCPLDADASTMAIGFAIYCERDWLLGLPPSFDMVGQHGRRCLSAAPQLGSPASSCLAAEQPKRWPVRGLLSSPASSDGPPLRRGLRGLRGSGAAPTLIRRACSNPNPNPNQAGVFFGGLAGGRIADRHGRRRTYLTSLSLFALLYSLSPFAPSFAAYCLMKFGIGYAATHGHGHGTWTWTWNMDMEMEHGHGTWT